MIFSHEKTRVPKAWDHFKFVWFVIPMNYRESSEFLTTVSLFPKQFFMPKVVYNSNDFRVYSRMIALLSHKQCRDTSDYCTQL